MTLKEFFSGAECATGDITVADTHLLNERVCSECKFRNENGYVLHTNKQGEDLFLALEDMKKKGFSEKFREIYQSAAKAGYRYLIIDSDGEPAREETDLSWEQASVPTFQINEPTDLVRALCHLEKDKLEAIIVAAVTENKPLEDLLLQERIQIA